MSGKQSGIKIISKRFKYALAVNQISLNQLGSLLKNSDGVITKRSIQRNLQNSLMQYEVLNSLCKLLNVSPEYITGEFNYGYEEFIDKYKMNGNSGDDPKTQAFKAFYMTECLSRKDPEGFFIPEYNFHLGKERSDNLKEALMTYLANRGFTQVKYDEAGYGYLDYVTREYFENHFLIIEAYVRTVVQNYINGEYDQKESE